VIRVLLVDDQALVREGLRRILSQRQGCTIVAECDDGDEVLDALREHEADVIVMDIRMRRVSGAEATRAVVAAGGPPVLVLTTFDDDETLSSALRAGAAGFVLKDAPGEDIVRATKEVAAGGAWLDPGVVARVLTSYRAGEPERRVDGEIELLTAREREVLTLVGRGASNTEIAAALFVGEATVKSHIGNVFAKLGLRDRAAAIVYAFDNGIVVRES
jgi:DNA-binding NarL/FixJ family response regulator